MTDAMYLFTISLIAGTFVLIFGMRAFASFQDARARTAKEDAYRSLAATATAVQGEAVARLAGLQSELAGVSSRLAAIEKILRDVG